MSGETRITVVGRLTEDPTLRFTPSGQAVANWTVASNARRFNKDTSEWEDQPPLFLRCSIWREYAENVVESLVKGDLVIVTGNLTQRSYDKDGTKITTYEMQAEEVGAALRFRAFVHGDKGQGPRPSRAASQPAADPWVDSTPSDVPF